MKAANSVYYMLSKLEYFSLLANIIEGSDTEFSFVPLLTRFELEVGVRCFPRSPRGCNPASLSINQWTKERNI